MQIPSQFVMLSLVALFSACGAPSPTITPSSDLEGFTKDGAQLPASRLVDDSEYDRIVAGDPLGNFVVSAPKGIYFRDPQYPEKILSYDSPGHSHGERGILPFGTFMTAVAYADTTRNWIFAYRTADDSDRPILGIVNAKLMRKTGAQPDDASGLDDTGSDAALSATSGYYFPISKRPPDFVRHDSHARYFSAPRPGTTRSHAACDLMMPGGTPVYAIADGVVKSWGSFYSGTNALVVRHASVVARYGEVKSMARGLAIGSKVRAGQLIAYIGAVRSGSSMLHFELYDDKASGGLTVPGNKSYPLLKSPLNRKRYERNRYLVDATDHLMSSMNKLPGKN